MHHPNRNYYKTLLFSLNIYSQTTIPPSPNPFIQHNPKMGFDDFRNTGLVLGLGFPSLTGSEPKSKPSPIAAHKISEPSLTLSLSGEMYDQINRTVIKVIDCSEDLYRQDSAASSLVSNVSVKREREIVNEEVKIERVSLSRGSDEDDDGPNGRKKLRLTKAQTALLEESFTIHSTLNPRQKQELARALKLRPRQVEVWFQNRRARTKLKQTEIDCEFLKKCCETLTEENRRLQKELQELKAVKVDQPLYMQLPAATLTMCPSCERIGGGVAKTKPHFCNHFTNPSAAC